jgi:predicted phage terminase large subunit-like protein
VEYTPEGEIHKLVWSDGSGRFIWASDILKIVAFHDPALCESKDADYAAIVVCAIDTKGYMYCLEAYIEKVIPSRQVEQAFFMYEKWRWDVLYLEENNFQGILKENYHAMQEANARMRVIGVKQTQNKIKRIASLEPLVTNGQLLFHEDLNPRLISQLRLFPTTHDDGPDALRGALDKFIPKARYLR